MTSHTERWLHTEAPEDWPESALQAKARERELCEALWRAADRECRECAESNSHDSCEECADRYCNQAAAVEALRPLFGGDAS